MKNEQTNKQFLDSFLQTSIWEKMKQNRTQQQSSFLQECQSPSKAVIFDTVLMAGHFCSHEISDGVIPPCPCGPRRTCVCAPCSAWCLGVEHTRAHIPVDAEIPAVSTQSHRETTSPCCPRCSCFKILSAVGSKGPPHISQQMAQRRVLPRFKIQFVAISYSRSLTGV